MLANGIASGNEKSDSKKTDFNLPAPRPGFAPSRAIQDDLLSGE
jgi:hypothetical protein